MELYYFANGTLRFNIVDAAELLLELVPDITCLCAEITFGSRPFMYNKTEISASFGTFCTQIGQLVAAQRVFKHSEEFPNRRHFPRMTAILQFSNIFQRLTLPRKIDQFGCKMCQKNCKDVDYKLLLSFFQKYFVVHEDQSLSM